MPRSQAEADDVREFVVRTVAAEMTRFRLKRFYLHVDCGDPSDALLARFGAHKPPIVTSSLFTEWENERGCGAIALGHLSWSSDDRVSVEVGQCVGPLSGYGSRWLLGRRGKTWVIIKRTPTWIS